jgi:hypothetical protein
VDALWDAKANLQQNQPKAQNKKGTHNIIMVKLSK